MAKLIFHLPNGDERTAELRPGEPLTIGRAADNALVLPEDSVSRQHARLTWRDAHVCLLEDLQSANGTALNGATLTQPTPLEDGDCLQLGEATAVYLATEADATRLPGVEPIVGALFAARYRIEKSLGETFEYHNFLVTDITLGQPASLKIFSHEMISQAGGFDRGAQEFARVHAAPPHPGLIRLLDFGRWRGRCYLAAEWIEGFPLLDLLRKHGALDVRDAMLLARQAAAAADHAHAHRQPAPDLHLRSTLIAFHPPAVPTDEWERLLVTPIVRWPSFVLKLAPRLFAPAPPSDPPPAPVLTPLRAFVYELLGHAHPASGAGRPKRVGSLGEQGNEVLTRGVGTPGDPFSSGTAFVDALSQAAGVAPPADPRTLTLPGVPLPLPTTAPADLPPELLALTEQIAAGVHELLLAARRRDGWTYGPQPDETKKQHPFLVPYPQLPESEKQYDRDMALGTVRAILQLGCRILPPPAPDPALEK